MYYSKIIQSIICAVSACRSIEADIRIDRRKTEANFPEGHIDHQIKLDRRNRYLEQAELSNEGLVPCFRRHLPSIIGAHCSSPIY